MVLYFYAVNNENGWASNFYRCKFIINANIINKTGETVVYSAEQAIMWLKAILMDDADSAMKIANETSPSKCKQLGRKVKPFDQTKWLEHRNIIAYEVLKLKFQNPYLKQKLLDTENENIAEASPRDKIWGIGISISDAINGKPWNGENILGNTLIGVRANIIGQTGYH